MTCPRTLLARLRRSLGASAPRYECPLCARSFDRERANCPACGCTEIAGA